MKFKTCLAVVVTALSFSTLGFAKAKEAPAPAMDPQMMEAFTKASTPGEEHKLLQNYVGNWNYTIKWWMKPGTKPEVSQGSAEVESILGGRFIRQKAKGTSMGQPFEGMGLTGYDNIKKHYSTLWVDNMSTAMMSGVGNFDAKTDTIVDQGSMSCPMSPSGTRNYRAVWTLPVKDSYKYQMFSNAENGKEFKMMEIVYSKAK